MFVGMIDATSSQNEGAKDGDIAFQKEWEKDLMLNFQNMWKEDLTSKEIGWKRKIE